MKGAMYLPLSWSATMYILSTSAFSQQDTTMTISLSYETVTDTIVTDILYTEYGGDKVKYTQDAQVIVVGTVESWNGKPQRTISATYFYEDRRITIITR